VATAVDWDELDRLSGATDLTVTPEPLRVLG
jgi:YD repeat-containing protein